MMFILLEMKIYDILISPSTPASKLDTSPALRYSDGSGGSDDYPVAPPLPPPPSQDVIDEVSCGYSQPHSEVSLFISIALLGRLSPTLHTCC